jgi:uncharacterized protein YndB with AHSA1/START domain
MSTRIVVERSIQAPPEKVWPYVSSPDRWLEWQGLEAQIDPTAGGVYRVNIRGDGFACGEVVHVEPPNRISFTWGFDTPDHPIPVGATLVTIDLIPDAEGAATVVRLTQQEIPALVGPVRHGWEHYLDRLVVVAEGGDPGPDPTISLR